MALTALAPATVRPQSGDRYDVTGTVSVTGPAAASVQDVTYTVTGAEFVTASGTSATVTRPATDSAPAFTLTHQGAAKVTVTASAPGFHDTLSLNDTASADLSPYDVSLTGLTPSTATADQSGDQKFTATVHRDGFTGNLDYALVGAPADLSLTDGRSRRPGDVHGALGEEGPAGHRLHGPGRAARRVHRLRRRQRRRLVDVHLRGDAGAARSPSARPRGPRGKVGRPVDRRPRP